MNARNLGVVFGRTPHSFQSPNVILICPTLATLMRSRDPGAEFSDMAGKALSVEWLVENAQRIFNQNHTTTS